LKEKINILKFYFSYVGFGMVLLVSFSFITGMLESVGISLVFPIIQNLLLGENSIGNLKISFIDDITKLIGIETSNKNLIILLFGTFILKAVFKFTTGYIKVFYSSRFLLQLRNNLLNLFTNLDYLGYTKRDAGKLSNSFTLEVENLISGFIYFSNYLVTIFTGFSFIFFILTINAWFALIILLFGATYYSLFKGINLSIKDISTSITENNSDFNSLLIQYIHSFKYLKSTNSFDKLKQQLIETVKRIRNLKIKKDIKANFISSIQEPALLLIIALVIFLSLNIIKIPAASVFMLLMLFYRSTNYFLTSQNTWNTFLGQTGSTRSIMSLQASLIENKEVIEGTKYNKLVQSIDLKDISFYYNQNKIVLKNITISIPAYRTIAFVGKSGSGKSTLINIITGLIIPKEGRVLLDKIPLNTINLHSWRNQIGYITQESVIFNDTLLNNITMWDYHEEKDSERLKNAIEMSHLSDFIQNQNDLSKLVGDRGITISGGQRQRICIARELYKSPSLLILDEATSALDSETEKYVQESIDALKGKITLILIAHRFSTIKNADIIHVMEAGKVVESGTFSELVENGSGFKKIYKLQNI
jgi:subfamily B ATP-binding cassette protein MsbA